MERIIIVPDGIKGKSAYPMGMCGMDKYISKSKIKIIGNQKNIQIKGDLNEWGCPVCEMIISTGKHFTYVKAIIDTGAYHIHVNSNLLKDLNSNCNGEEIHDNPLYGKQSLEIHNCIYSFKEFPEMYFVSDVRSINYEQSNMIIGTRFITEFCDLHIYGNKKRFELNVYIK